MELIILGSGTGVPTLKRGSPGLVVRIGNENLLFDSGSGTLRKMIEAGIDYRTLNYLFYTHLHPDHTADLVPFLFATKNTPGFYRHHALHLYGPKRFSDFFRKLSDLFGEWIISPEYELSLRELENTHLDFGEWTVQTQRVRHTYNSIGYRVDCQDGCTIVYSGDTDYCPEIVTLARKADILVLECSFPDDQKVPGHLTPSLAAQIAAEAQCQRLVLTHLYPPCDQTDILTPCQKLFGGEVIVAEDLMKIVV